MGASSSSSMRARARDCSDELAGALWLAKKEMERAWHSYPLTGLLLLFLGFFVVPSVSGVFDLKGFGAGGQRMDGFDPLSRFFLAFGEWVRQAGN